MSSTPPDAFRYSPGFYDYIEQGARRSTARLLPIIQAALAPASVLDVGCGRGIWLEAWIQLGVQDVLGLDGAYVDPARLAIPSASFRSTDIAQPFDLGRRWGSWPGGRADCRARGLTRMLVPPFPPLSQQPNAHTR